MDGTYKEGEEKQILNITMVFNVKHNPGTDSHLRQLALSYLTPKGIKVYEKDGQIFIE